MADMMQFPETWEEYEEQYGFTDKEEIYTNGSRLIESFRVKQWLDHIKPKTGKWKLDQDGMDWNIPAWRCSECGFVANYIGVEANGFGNNPMNWAGSKFCPQCGARITGYER